MVGIYDQDLSRRTLLKYPQLYGPGLREEHHNLKLFVLIMLDSLWQKALSCFINVPFFAYSNRSLNESSLGDSWILSVVLLVDVHSHSHGCVSVELDSPCSHMGLHSCNF